MLVHLATAMMRNTIHLLSSSLSSPLCIRASAKEIAYASIYAASKSLGIKLQKTGREWFKYIGISEIKIIRKHSIHLFL